MSLRQRLGALAYDWPRFLRHIGGDWTLLRNRNETITSDGRGVRCEWLYSSDLHIAKVYPFTAQWLMRRALKQWPIAYRDAPASTENPEVSFLIGHRGTERLPNLHETLRSIAGQSGAAIECIVVEQSAAPEIRSSLPSWVRYVHTPSQTDYCRAATFNAAARIARGRVLVPHDNDLLIPERYAAEVLQRIDEGWDFVDAKRFLFYLDAHGKPVTVSQNLKGGSVAITADAYRAAGGYDEGFIGWGGEDLEFWERARVLGRVYEFGWLPLVHLWHAPQAGKVRQESAPAQRRYYEVRDIAPAERIARLREANFSNEK
ncbi:MAG: glycosyltransferase family 2 protein [Thermoanaerobaculia bacterium]